MATMQSRFFACAQNDIIESFSMRKCEDCRLILEDDVRHCPKCGKSVAAEPTAVGPPSVEVGALLTSANLHRIRREWDEAVDDLSEAMRRDPKNPDIASLMGGIYEQRGMLDDALIWYQIAVEMNPANAPDRASLERVKERLIAQSRSSMWAMQKHTRLWAALLAAMFLLIVALAVILAVRRPVVQQPTERAPVAAQSRTGYNATPKPPASAPRHGAVGDGESTGKKTLAPPSARTPGESAVRTEITGSAAVQDSGAAIDDVAADPRDSVVIVTFTIPAKPGLARSQVIRAAWAVAKAAFDSSDEAKFITTRCLITPAGAGSTQIGFVGDIGRATMEAQSANPSVDQIKQAFTRQWWNPHITQPGG